MARKASRRAANSRSKKSAAAKGRKSSATKRAGGAKRPAQSASARRRKVSVESFVRCIRTLHDLDLIQPFLQSAEQAKLTLTMDAAALERVMRSVNELRHAAFAETESRGVESSSFATPSAAAPASRRRGMEGVKPFSPRQGDPFPGPDPFDF